VAAEWFRVQQHVGQAQMKNYRTDAWATYFNQTHNFASEPTDFGVQAGDFEEYLSPTAGYHLNMPSRKYRIQAEKNIGIMTTIYQNQAPAALWVTKSSERHPEFALYDATGNLLTILLLAAIRIRWN